MRRLTFLLLALCVFLIQGGCAGISPEVEKVDTFSHGIYDQAQEHKKRDELQLALEKLMILNGCL